jgi:p-cumate 2,3-dioxygenase beta subunit
MEVEDFLYKEAELLDDWRLSEWLDLFADEAIYKVPPLADPNLTTSNALFVVHDNKPILRSRVQQLLDGTAWAESPRSKICRLITNVRVEITGNSVRTRANFHVHKSRRDQTSDFYGEYRHQLIRNQGTFLIVERLAILAHNDFSQGYLSFIL